MWFITDNKNSEVTSNSIGTWTSASMFEWLKTLHNQMNLKLKYIF